MNKSKLLLALFAQLERENVVSVPQSARLYGETERRVREALEQLVFCYDAVGLRLELHENHARLVRRGTEQVLRLTREESDVLLQLLAAQGYGPEGPLATKLLAAKGYLAGEGAAGGAAGSAIGASGRDGGMLESEGASGDETSGEDGDGFGTGGAPEAGSTVSGQLTAPAGAASVVGAGNPASNEPESGSGFGGASSAAPRPAAARRPAPLIAALPQPAASEVLGVLAAACEDEEHHHLRILYHKDAAAQPEERVVEPWAITAEGEHRYLQAWCLQAQAWRTFRTDRILAAEQLHTRFTPRADTPRPGAAPQGAPQTALIALAAGSELPSWPGLARAGTAEDGRPLVSVPWFGTPWLPRQIVSCFGTAQPLQPPELVEATKAYAQELLEGC